MNSRLYGIEERISHLKDSSEKHSSLTQKRIFKKENSLRDLWDNIKHINIHIIEVPEGED